MSSNLTVAGFFAGIGGIEEGLHKSNYKTVFLCEKDIRAQSVLKAHYPNVDLNGDIREVTCIPKTDIVTAGFPCQDLSQAGLKQGISGTQSGVVQHLFRILKKQDLTDRPRWIIIENVSYMISLDQGNAIKYITNELENLGYMWAYRIIDSRAFGVPQRRLRMVLVASKTEDVRSILFSSDIADPPNGDNLQEVNKKNYYGFYWTEGKRGVGWTINGIPTLKIGSKIGIPSPPAIWIPETDYFGTPDIRDAERLQGFEDDWTIPAMSLPKAKKGDRWHLVGNAVCIPMSQWIGEQLVKPGFYDNKIEKEIHRKKWPKAAYGYKGKVFEVKVSTWPVSYKYKKLKDYLKYPLNPLSEKGMKGFYSRAVGSELINYPIEFIKSMESYLNKIEGEKNGISK